MPEEPAGSAHEAAAALGSEIRRLRERRGMSQRALTRLIGLSAHSNLADYETGRRLPPADIVRECERVLEVTDGHLTELRSQALAARADEHGQAATEPAAAPAAPSGAHGLRAFLLRPAGLATMGVVAVGIAVLVAVVTIGPGSHKAKAHHTKSGVISVITSPNGTRLADNLDPSKAGCTADEVNLASVPVRLPRPMTVHGHRLLIGAAIGNITVRFSAACQAGWARFDPLPVVDSPGLGKVTVILLRPSDGGRTVYRPGQLEEAYGNILLTGAGCVRAETVVRFSSGIVAQAKTRCVRGTPPPS